MTTQANSTTFIEYSQNTPIEAAWLNDVNALTYGPVADQAGRVNVTKDLTFENYALDASPVYHGTNSVITSGDMWTLLGGQLCMEYWLHNVNIDANGNFLGRNDTGNCEFYGKAENGYEFRFDAASAVAGTVPTWVLSWYETPTQRISAGQYVSTLATGTAPFAVSSTTPVANLAIGGNAATATTATNQSGGTVNATTVAASGVITSTVSTGTAPFTVASTTKVANLAIAGNADTATTATTAGTCTGNAATASKLANIAAGLTSVTTVNDTNTPTTGGVTLAGQVAATPAVWRIRAQGTFVAVSSATGRNAVIQPFWGSTALPAVTVAVLASVAQTTNWEAEFILTGSSTTAIWTTGYLSNKIDYPAIVAGTSAPDKLDIVTPAGTTVTAGAQTVDLRVSMSVAVATDQWVVHSVEIERII